MLSLVTPTASNAAKVEADLSVQRLQVYSCTGCAVGTEFWISATGSRVHHLQNERPSCTPFEDAGESMKSPRRRFLQLAASAPVLSALGRVASAQTYPSRPVLLLVGYAPGGVNDIVARLTGQMVAERLGQQFIIENRPGAGSNLATEAVVRANPDGYTLL